MTRKKFLAFMLSAVLLAGMLPNTVFRAEAADTSLGQAELLSLYYYPDEGVAVCQVSKGPDDADYEFEASVSSSFPSSTSKQKVVSYQSDGYEVSLSSLPSGMTGYVHVRYTKTVDGTTYTGEWSNVVSKTMASSSGITASDITKSSSSKEQTFSIGATASGASSLNYVSNNSSITVNSSGQVTVKAGYVGSGQITITIVDSDGNETTSKRITVTIKEAEATTATTSSSTTTKPTTTAASTTTDASTEATSATAASATASSSTTASSDIETPTESQTPSTPVTLDTPSVVSATNLAAGINIRWTSVDNADGYRIYRKTASSTRWQNIQTVTGGDTTSTVDKSVKNGAKYIYTVRAYHETDDTLTFSRYQPAGKTIYRLTSPAHKSLKNSASKKVTVKWKKNSAASGYQIQYSTSQSFRSKKTVTIRKGSTTSTTLSKLTKKKIYYVRTRAYKTVNGRNYYSAWSSIHYITVRK